MTTTSIMPSDMVEQAYATSLGMVREQNEDNVAVVAIPDAPLGSCMLVVVADGMGGHAAGEVASALCVGAVVDFVQSHHSEITSWGNVRRILESSVRSAHSAIQTRAAADRVEMGTTATVALYCNGKAAFAHAGDSRAYILGDSHVRQVTEDDSWVAAQVKAGVLTEDEAAVSVHRNMLVNALTAAPRLDVHVYQEDLADGEDLLLCTDGLHGVIDPQMMWTIARKSGSPQAAAEQLVNAANHLGGPDNITVVCLRRGAPVRYRAETIPIILPSRPLKRRYTMGQAIAICAAVVVILFGSFAWRVSRSSAGNAGVDAGASRSKVVDGPEKTHKTTKKPRRHVKAPRARILQDVPKEPAKPKVVHAVNTADKPINVARGGKHVPTVKPRAVKSVTKSSKKVASKGAGGKAPVSAATNTTAAQNGSGSNMTSGKAGAPKVDPFKQQEHNSDTPGPKQE